MSRTLKDLTESEKVELGFAAVSLQAEGKRPPAIAKELDLSVQTVRPLLDAAFKDIRAWRVENEMYDLEQSVAEQARVIEECFKRLDAFPLDTNSLVVPALATAASQAAERKGRLLGHNIDRRKVDIAGSLPVNVTIAFDRAERSSLPGEAPRLDVIDGDFTTD